MPTTSRVGFSVPANTDFADETLYYDNNVTTYEAELPSVANTVLPGSGSYSGQVRTVSVSSPNAWTPNYEYVTSTWDGSQWAPWGNFGIKKSLSSQWLSTNGSTVQSSTTEVFQPSPLPGFSSINIVKNSVVRFSVSACIDLTNGVGANGDFEGKFNIFINPSSGVQPTPATPGAVRLSFPIRVHPKTIGSGLNKLATAFGELIWQSPLTSGNPQQIGVSAYLSVTGANGQPNGGFLTAIATASNSPATSIYVENLGQA